MFQTCFENATANCNLIDPCFIISNSFLSKLSLKQMWLISQTLMYYCYKQHIQMCREMKGLISIDNFWPIFNAVNAFTIYSESWMVAIISWCFIDVIMIGMTVTEHLYHRWKKKDISHFVARIFFHICYLRECNFKKYIYEVNCNCPWNKPHDRFIFSFLLASEFTLCFSVAKFLPIKFCEVVLPTLGK